MPSDLEKALKSTALKVQTYVENVATLKVDTRYVLVGDNASSDFEQAKPAIRTVIRLDGDCETILPVMPGESGQLEINANMYEIHQRNVQTAIEYRANMLSALLETLRSYGG
jgi:hypothetical protein